MRIELCDKCNGKLIKNRCPTCSEKKNILTQFRCSGREGFYQCAVVKPLIKFYNEYLCHKHYDEKRPKGFVDKLFEKKLEETRKDEEHLGLNGYEYFQLKYGSLFNALGNAVTRINENKENINA